MYNNNETIYAPLTIKGRCSVYVIRISGKATLECLKILGVKKELKHREATVCNLKDYLNNNENLDEALLIYFKGPNSFTGEDVCEINLHCSDYIIQRVFKILSSIKNVRLAEHGEFSRRAFLNGKIDLMQAESIVDLIDSKTELQHKKALEQLKGKNSKFYDDLRTKILDILSNLEALIDFPEDEIDPTIINLAENKVFDIINFIENILNDNNTGKKIKDGIKISIIGEPNAGKSSLLNYLSGEDIAIVSDIAGTTRDILSTTINIDGIPVILYDTAGIRITEDPIEKEGVNRAIKNAKDTDLKILMLDPNNLNINENILNLIDKDTIIVVNKIDIFNIDINNIKNLFPDNKILQISVNKEININLLLEEISNFIQKNITPYTDTFITNERYRVELSNALDNLKNINFSMPIEIISELVRKSAFYVGRITGVINSEEILNNIFSKFCIGK